MRFHFRKLKSEKPGLDKKTQFLTLNADNNWTDISWSIVASLAFKVFNPRPDACYNACLTAERFTQVLM